jgi:hypothetical protein
MTGGGARSWALRARGHDPFGYAQDKKRRGPKGPPLQGLFTESCAGERLPEEGEEAGAGAEAVISKGPFWAPRGKGDFLQRTAAGSGGLEKHDTAATIKVYIGICNEQRGL